MNKSLCGVFVGMYTFAMCVFSSAPAGAQMSEMKEKPPMYSYVGNWSIPRAQWADMEKNEVADQKILATALANGTIVAYGYDVNLVHQADGPTHDDWWSSMSMAGMINVLEQFYKSGNAVNPVLSAATKHWDSIYVSRYYNWHSGSWKDAYTRVGVFNLKKDAPPDALEMVSKNLFVPVMEKLLADGAIHEYEIDSEAIHTQSPNTFYVVLIAANADGLDKFNAALQEALKASPMATPAFGSLVDFSQHRDELARTNATYK